MVDLSLTAIVPATDRPATLTACAGAIRASAKPPEELLVITDPPGSGPAAARNAGARSASGDVLVFVDADVEVQSDAFARIRRAFARDPELTALFGSYDATPAAPGTVAGFRNLLHHHVHQRSAGRATTFWAGLGAVRRDAFLAAGGFDARRFPAPSVEDIELGVRLTDRGARVELDPGLLGTHHKAWSLGEMVRTDLLRRGVPWVVLLLRRGRGSTALNLGWPHRLSALASLALAGALLRRRPGVAACSVGLLVGLNRSLYLLLWRTRGPWAAASGVALHALHHAVAAVAVPLGALAYARELWSEPSGAGDASGPGPR